MTIYEIQGESSGVYRSVIVDGIKNNVRRASFRGESCGSTAKKSSTLIV